MVAGIPLIQGVHSLQSITGWNAMVMSSPPLLPLALSSLSVDWHTIVIAGLLAMRRPPQ